MSNLSKFCGWWKREANDEQNYTTKSENDVLFETSSLLERSKWKNGGLASRGGATEVLGVGWEGVEVGGRSGRGNRPRGGCRICLARTQILGGRLEGIGSANLECTSGVATYLPTHQPTTLSRLLRRIHPPFFLRRTPDPSLSSEAIENFHVPTDSIAQLFFLLDPSSAGFGGKAVSGRFDQQAEMISVIAADRIGAIGESNNDRS